MAVFAANGFEWVATFFAALAVGVIAVPCNGWWAKDGIVRGGENVAAARVESDSGKIVKTQLRAEFFGHG